MYWVIILHNDPSTVKDTLINGKIKLEVSHYVVNAIMSQFTVKGQSKVA